MGKKILSCILTSVFLLFACSCSPAPTQIEPEAQIHTDCEGVYLSFVSVSEDGEGNRLLELEWHNETDTQALYGEAYRIEYRNDGKWEDAATTELQFILIACVLEGHSTHKKTYSTEGHDLSREGRYRLCTDFSLGSGSNHTTWVEFDITKE